jgi:hypothetical protein
LLKEVVGPFGIVSKQSFVEQAADCALGLFVASEKQMPAAGR